jgi:hypothetical protein
VTALSDGTVAAVGRQPGAPPSQSQKTPLILQNPESAPGSGGSGAAAPARHTAASPTTTMHPSGPAVPAGPLFVDASADRRWSLAGPSTAAKGALLDTPLRQDPLNARSVDPVFAADKPDPALSLARDRSVAPQGPEDPLGRMDAIDRLFTELI